MAWEVVGGKQCTPLTHVPRITHRRLASSLASMMHGNVCFVCSTHHGSTPMQIPLPLHPVQPRCSLFLDPKSFGPMTVSDPTILSVRRPRHPHLCTHRRTNQPTRAAATRQAPQTGLLGSAQTQADKLLPSKSRPTQWIRGKFLCVPLSQHTFQLQVSLVDSSRIVRPHPCPLCQCWLHLSESRLRSIGTLPACTAEPARRVQPSDVWLCNVSKYTCRLKVA